ncbi:hypothetical protein JCM11641_000638 [Rhodosporidiobolus odoratus]
MLIWLVRWVLYALGLAAPVKVVHHPEPTTLVSLGKDGRKRSIRLDGLLKQCPSLVGRDAWYVPTMWLANGSLATIAAALFRYAYDPITYTRELIRVPDGGTVTIDFAPPIVNEDLFDDRPILVVSHGLTGGSHESYVRGILAIVTKPKEDGGLGWRAAVVNSRGCANTPVTSQKLYNGATTDDLRSAIAFISKFAPDAPLYGVGFSLGGNQMAKYAGEEGEECPLIAVIAVAAPFDWVRCHIALCSGWMRMFFSRAMARNLRTLLARNAGTFESHPKLDWEVIFGNPYQSLFEYDSLVTAPLAGYGTAIEYCRAASASTVLHNVAVPLLAISSINDPIVDLSCIPFTAATHNPNLIVATTKHGGHLGWHSGFFRPRRWVSKPVAEFLKAVHEARPQVRQARETVPLRRDGRTPKIGDEMVCLEGREGEVGFRRVKAEEHAVEGQADMADVVVEAGVMRGL